MTPETETALYTQLTRARYLLASWMMTRTVRMSQLTIARLVEDTQRLLDCEVPGAPGIRLQDASLTPEIVRRQG